MSTTTLLLALSLLLTLITLSMSTRPFTVRDLHALKRLTFSDAGMATTQGSNPVALFTLSEWNSETNKKRTSIALVNLTSSQVSTVTSPAWGESDVSPKLLPDGKTILFLSSRQGGEMRPYVSDLYGRRVIPLPGFSLPDNMGIDNLVLAPNGRYFLFSTGVFVDCTDFQCTSDRLKEQSTQNYMVYDQLYIRHWDTWSDHTVSHLIMQPINFTDSQWSAVGEPRDIMSGVNADSPVKPFGGTEQIAISPDGNLVAFNAEQIQHDTAWRTDWDIYITDVSKPTTPQLLTGDRKARTVNPVFSPDGKYLYYGAMDVPQAESDRVHIERREISTGKVERILDSWDRSVDAISFDKTGKFLIVEAADDAIGKVFAISLADFNIKELITSGSNHGLMLVRGSSDNLFAYARNTVKAPGDIFTAAFDANAVTMELKQHTNVNKDLLDQLTMVDMHKFYFPCADPQPDNNGKGCQGYIMLPVGYQAGNSYPVTHLVHGGPEGMWDDSWSYRWNPQLWASAGFAVVMVNPHGSTSFGQKFTDAVLRNWGGTPYQDLQKGLDHALTLFDGLDSNRIGYAGASYGAFMAAWTATQTNRYKAIVAHDGVFDLGAMGYSTEELFFDEHEYGDTFFNNPEGRAKWDPKLRVKDIDQNQNILVIHGGKDYRIVDAQGIGFFTALQRRGINSRLLYFPDENHWVLRQRNSIQWYDQVLGWLNKYVKNA